MSVVFYFMDGCGACKATWPTWRKVKSMAKGQMKEVESAAMPPTANVDSFPTFVKLNDEGMEVYRVVGRQTNAPALMKELGLARRSRSTRRRRGRPGTTRRKIR